MSASFDGAKGDDSHKFSAVSINDPFTTTPSGWTAICGVVDLKNGHAVAAVGGHRDQYQPIASVNGDAVELAKHYSRLGCGGLYVADLDGIQAGRRNVGVLRRLVDVASAADQTVWIDAGYRGTRFDEMNDAAWARVGWVVATETGIAPEIGRELCDHLGAARVAVSLDFRDDDFLGQDLSGWRELIRQESAAAVIVLNLSDVGGGGGGRMDGILAAIRRQCPAVHLIGGGGVRSIKDVNRLRSLGCDQVLVATAIRP